MIIGMDEVGRGAWAGPLVVGAVCLDVKLDELCDSKLLSRVKREIIDKQIRASARYIGLGIVEPAEIDELGLSKAHFLAYQRAIGNISENVEVIIDGNINYLPDLPNVKCIIRADQTVPCVSAASIIAKVYRDNLMAKLALDFPEYGFDSHVGYGTKRHHDALIKFGVTQLHRTSYKPINAILLR